MADALNEQVDNLMGVVKKEQPVPLQETAAHTPEEDSFDELDEIITEEFFDDDYADNVADSYKDQLGYNYYDEEKELYKPVPEEEEEEDAFVDDDEITTTETTDPNMYFDAMERDTIEGTEGTDILYGGKGVDVILPSTELGTPENLSKERELPTTTTPVSGKRPEEVTAEDLGGKLIDVAKTIGYSVKDTTSMIAQAPARIVFGLWTMGGMAVDFSPAAAEIIRVSTGNGIKRILKTMKWDENPEDAEDIVANLLLGTFFNNKDLENYDNVDVFMEEGRNQLITGIVQDGYGQKYFEENILAWFQVPKERMNIGLRMAGLGTEFFMPLVALKLVRAGMGKFADLSGPEAMKAMDKLITQIDKIQKRLAKKGKVSSKKLRKRLAQTHQLKRRLAIGYEPRVFRKEYMQFGAKTSSSPSMKSWVRDLTKRHIEKLTSKHDPKLYAPLQRMNLSTGVFEVAKPQLDMAAAMALGAVVSEEIYRSLGFDEKDSQVYGMFTALPFGMFGISSGLGAIPIAGALTSQYTKLRFALENHYHRFVTGDELAANVAKLRSEGKTAEQIDSIFMKEKKDRTESVVDASGVTKEVKIKKGDYILDEEGRRIVNPDRLAALAAETPEAARANYALGQALASMEDGPVKQNIIKSIQYMLDPKTGLSAKFKARFKKDWEDGLISDETYNQTLGDFPLLLENVAPLVALRALRDQLASRVSIGVHKSLDSLNLLSQLDNLNNVLSQQSNMLRESMEAQIKRVLKENPNLKEGTTTHIFLRNMREKVKYLADDSKDIAGLVQNAMQSIHRKGAIDNVKSSMDDAFGKDIISEEEMRKKLIREGLTLEEVAKTELITDLRVWPEHIPENKILKASQDRLTRSGKDQEESVLTRMTALNAEIDKRYKAANLSSVTVEVNDLVSQLSKTIEELSVPSKAMGVAGPRTTTINFIQDARKQGLNNFVKNLRNNNIEEDQIVSQLLLFKKTIEDKIDLKEGLAFKKFDESSLYKDVDGELVLNPDNVNNLITHISKAPTIPEIARDIPTHLNLEQLKQLKTAAYNRANATSNSAVRLYQSTEAAAIDSAILKLGDDLIKAVESGAKSATKYEKEVIEKLKIANEYYKNTGAQVWKKRAGRLLRENFSGLQNNALKTPFGEKANIFEVAFIRHPNYEENAKAFKILFSELDDKGRVIEGTLDEKAVELLKQSVRRFLTKNVEGTTGSGLSKLPDGFIRHFLTNKQMFSGKEKQAFDNFLGLRNIEVDKGPFPITKNGELGTKEADEMVKKHIDTLTDEHKETLEASLLFKFKDMKEFGSTEEFFTKVFDSQHAWVNARATEDYYRDAIRRHGGINFADGMGKTPEARAIINNVNRYNNAVKFLRSQEVSPAIEDLVRKGIIKDADDAIARMGPRIVAGAENPKTPVEVLLETIETMPIKQQKEMKDALKIAFGRYLMSKVFVVSDNISIQGGKITNFSKKAMDAGKGLLGVQKEIDIKAFANLLDDHYDTLQLLYKDNPEHLNNLIESFQLSVATRGKTGLKGIIGRFGSAISPGQIQSRAWGVMRNVVSPKYVAGELTLQMIQMKKAEYLMNCLINPQVTKIVVEGMKAKGKLSPAYMANWKQIMATAILGSQNQNADWNVGRLQMWNDELLAAKMKAVYNVGAETINAINIFGDFPPSIEQTPMGIGTRDPRESTPQSPTISVPVKAKPLSLNPNSIITPPLGSDDVRITISP